MFKTLDQLIDKLLPLYNTINESWGKMDSFNSINLKKKSIADIQKEQKIWNSILQYRKFMAAHQLDVLQEISSLQSDVSRISVRIKQLNSIEYKIYRYNVGELRGKVPINKCLNDLFGMRIIMDDSFTHDDLKEHIDASKKEYVASHLYIKPSNQLFPWELQIWKKEDERNNLESHKLYKQDYTSWENEYKDI